MKKFFLAAMLLVGMSVFSGCNKDYALKRSLIGKWAVFDNNLTVFSDSHFQVQMYLEFTKDNMLRSWILNGSNTAEYDNCVLYTSPDLNWSEIAGSPMPYKIQGNTLVFNGNTYEVENGSGRVILQSGNDGEIIYRINKFEVR